MDDLRWWYGRGCDSVRAVYFNLNNGQVYDREDLTIAYKFVANGIFRIAS